MKTSLLFLFSLICLFNKAYCSNQLDSIFVLRDSTIDHKEILYKYKIVKVKPNSTITEVLYMFETQTVSFVESSFYHLNRLMFFSFTFYDEPTGRVFLLLYDSESGRLFKTEWFDDNATGDKLINDQVSFRDKRATIREGESSRTYNIKLIEVSKR